MPAQELAFLRQRAVVWPFLGYDEYGQPVVDFPIEIPCRWLMKHREVLDPEGNTIALDAEVVVAQHVPMNSWMWKGDLEQWYSGHGALTRYGTGTAPAAPAYDLGSAAFDEELHEVKWRNETPDIKARHSFHKLGLMRIPNAKSVPLVTPPGGLTGDFSSGIHP
jgi:hypothetical protein